MSEVLPSPVGPMMWADLAPYEATDMSWIRDELLAAAAEAGLDEGVFEAPRSTKKTEPLAYMSRAIVVRIVVDAKQVPVLPERLLRVCFDWLDPAEQTIVATVGGVDFDLPRREAFSLFSAYGALGKVGLRSGVVTGIEKQAPRIALIGKAFPPYAQILLAGGGPALDDDGLAETVRQAADSVVAFESVAVRASVDVEDTFLDSFVLFWPVTTTRRLSLAAVDWDDATREGIADACVFQMLGPGHEKRMGGLPQGAVRLPGGMWTLWVGDPRDWIDPDSRAQVRERAREVLRPALL